MMATWRRALRFILLGWLLATAGGALAQTPAAPAAPTTTSAVEIERLIATLQDEQARARLVGELRVLLEAQRRQAPGAEPEESSPETLTARLLALLADQIAAVSDAGRALADLLTAAPQVLVRLADEVTDPDRRARMVRIAITLVAVLFVSWLAEWLARRALRPLHTRIEAAARSDGWTRLPLFVAELVVNLLPLVLFGAVAYVVLATLGADSAAGLTAAALINAYLLARAVNLTAAAVLSPGSALLRVLPLGDETAAYIHLWVRRFSNIGIYGYFAAQAIVYAGLPVSVRDFILRVLGLLVGMMMLALVLQSRPQVARWISGSGAQGADGARSVTAATGRRLRRRLAGLWHVVAILYVLVAMIVWLIRPTDGGRFVLNATALTALTWLGAAVAAFVVRAIVEAIFRATDNLREQFPTLKPRANQYLRLLTLACAVVVYGIAFLLMLQIWGARSLDWFATPLGRRVSAALAVIGIAMAIALAFWELGNVVLERWVGRPAEGGVSVDRREARVRTLMPIMQLLLMAVLALFVGFVVLSELGISIAPLLAGAGALGLAVGLGAQGMIKNLVTGVSMILTDTLAIGDFVTLADKSGYVERISISSVQLRSQDGTLHTVPFGNIAVVSNQTKDYAFAAFDIGVDYAADLDRANAIIAATAAELRRDPVIGAFVLGELDLMGVDAFTDRAVVIKARVKTLPGKQWDVARAFNGRLKRAFDAAGIDMPLARQNVRVIAAPPVPS